MEKLRKKRTLIFFLIFFYILPVFSNEFFFSLKPKVSFFTGQLQEQIFAISGYKISQLDWNTFFSEGVGLDLECGYKGFSLELNSLFALPVSCGKMYDSDWNATGLKHTYSIHENSYIFNSDLEFLVKYDFRKNFFHLKPFFSVRYLFDSFQARNGYGFYGSQKTAESLGDDRNFDVAWNDARAYKAKSLYGIDYFRHSFFVMTGFSFGFDIKDDHFLNFDFKISPFEYFYSFDTHHSKNEENNKEFEMFEKASFKSFDFSILYEYNFKKNLFFVSEFDFLYALCVKGLMNTNAFGFLGPSPQRAASGLWRINFSAGIKYRF